MISLEINDAALLGALEQAAQRVDRPADLMADIAEQWLVSTQDRVQEGQGPDGSPFAPRSQTTLDSYGQIPLGHPLNKSGVMRQQIANSSGEDYAEVGSNAVQAAMMHFGGTKAEFPHLWGDIPARPFLGASDQDRADMRETISDWLKDIFD